MMQSKAWMEVVQSIQREWGRCRIYRRVWSGAECTGGVGVGVGAGYREDEGGGGAVFTGCGLCSPGFYIWC